MAAWRGAVVVAISFGALSCAHPPRAGRGAVDRLRRNGGHFVLVFGSLSTPAGKRERPVIRFIYPGNSANPDALLWSTMIATGERFYAVLRAPSPAVDLDAIYVEVGSEMSGFDRIIYANLNEEQEPLALYVGEIEVRPASNRAAQGQKVMVETRDDFPRALRELRRLYPDFERAIDSATPVQKSDPEH